MIMSAPMPTPEYFSPDELRLAYKKSRLRYSGVSFLSVLLDPLLYKSLTLQVKAIRKEQQHGQPAPLKQAA